jgi:hypothetical protein
LPALARPPLSQVPFKKGNSQMHFPVLVIGYDIAAQLKPFEGVHFDSWQVGGRYSPAFKLKKGASGGLGDRSVPPAEKAIAAMARAKGGRVTGPGPGLAVVTGRDADMALKSAVDFQAKPFCPVAIVQDGRWTKCEDYQRQRLIDGVGIQEDETDPEVVARHRRVEAWQAAFKALIESLPGDMLLTVVDCHH